MSGPFPLTHEYYEGHLRDHEATWPTDPAVPDLPPLPSTDDPGLDPEAFLTTHYTNTLYPPKVAGPPAPLKDLVNGRERARGQRLLVHAQPLQLPLE